MMKNEEDDKIENLRIEFENIIQSMRGKKLTTLKNIEWWILNVFCLLIPFLNFFHQTNLCQLRPYIQIINMAKTEDFKGAFYQFKRMLPGAIASLLTQPLDVIKTNMINSPTLYFRELHGKIIDKGYRQYMRGT